MMLDWTSGDLQHLPLPLHLCCPKIFPHHPLRPPASRLAVREGGLGRTRCQSACLRGRVKRLAQRLTSRNIRNAGVVPVRSTRLVITSLRRTSWKRESNWETPLRTTLKPQQVSRAQHSSSSLRLEKNIDEKDKIDASNCFSSIHQLSNHWSVFLSIYLLINDPFIHPSMEVYTFIHYEQSR